MEKYISAIGCGHLVLRTRLFALNRDLFREFCRRISSGRLCTTNDFYDHIYSLEKSILTVVRKYKHFKFPFHGGIYKILADFENIIYMFADATDTEIFCSEILSNEQLTAEFCSHQFDTSFLSKIEKGENGKNLLTIYIKKMDDYKRAEFFLQAADHKEYKLAKKLLEHSDRSVLESDIVNMPYEISINKARDLINNVIKAENI